MNMYVLSANKPVYYSEILVCKPINSLQHNSNNNEKEKQFADNLKQLDQIKDKKQAIKTWIMHHFDEWDLEEAKDSEDGNVHLDGDHDWVFTDITHFYEHNSKMVESLNDETVQTIIDLIIVRAEFDIVLMDKGHCNCFDHNGFCFNSKGEFVIFHER